MVNPSFELWTEAAKTPDGWYFHSDAKLHSALTRTQGDAPDGQWSARVYVPVNDFVALQQYVAVEPLTKYRFTFRSRGTFQGKTVLVVEPTAGTPFEVDQTWNFGSPWRETSFEFTTGPEQKQAGPQFRLIGKGVVWFDRVVLEKVTP
jgi:hypothetical protein